MKLLKYFSQKYLAYILVLLSPIVFFQFYFNIKKPTYLIPEDTLIVGYEGGDGGRVMKRILSVAFPEYKIVYSNNVQPHLIIRTPFARKKKPLPWDAPYIFYSGERFSIKQNRKHIPPIAEIVTFEPKNNRQFYFPFILDVVDDIDHIRPNIQTERKHLAAYVNSNCKSHRERFFKLLRKVDSTAEALGKCSNTHSTAPGSFHDVHKIYQKYKFGFAMENHSLPGYITEKILTVYQGGAVPIFWGDKVVDKIFNPESYINLNNFKNFEQAIKYIQYVDSHPAIYKKMANAPIFRNNTPPEILRIFQNPPNKPLLKCAEFIRKEYFKTIL